MNRFKIVAASIALGFTAAALAAGPDEAFYTKAAEGGMAEVELGKLAQDKSPTASVKDYGAMMVMEHTSANDKLMTLAASKNIKLPARPSAGQMATKAKLEVLTGTTFDKSYIKGMVDDHKDTIKLFQTEASSGKDAETKAFASATLPTLQAHLKKIQAIATAQGVDAK